ncbi:organic cation transporter protein-like, isoform X1 [Octopus vulgaris]|uniref:Organic cation transporter protein-like, isoform X1 n=1 Tax=Octopus vulgaris TaxID=6645 RepID=A0AA36B9X2_OCTVU|nr:organic cation transporter protein-like, isoform X1 [Octopus vulgaris]
MVNYIKSRPLKCCLFEQICVDMDSQHKRLLLHAKVDGSQKKTNFSVIMDYEATIQNIGGFGFYQKSVLGLIALEIVPSDYLPYVSLYSQVMFTVGELVVVGIAYCTREWRLLSLVLAIIYFIFLFFMFVIDESPRWLISKGKLDKAEAILRKIAKRNGKEFYTMLTERTCNNETVPVNGSFGDIFKSRILLYRAFNMFFNWIAVNIVYYGLMFGSATLAGDLFVSTSLMAAVELAAYVVLILLGTEMKSKFGIGLPVILFGIFAIVAGVLSTFLPETKGYNLPDTFEEGENIGKKVKHKTNGEDNNGMVSD